MCQENSSSIKIKQELWVLYMKTIIHIFLSYSVFVRMRDVSDKIVEKIKTQTLSSVIFFENNALKEVTWKNAVESVRPQTTKWCMCIACYIPEATNTPSEYSET